MQEPTQGICREQDLHNENYDRIMCLKQEIERILQINCISLEQRLKCSENCESSIEEVFGLIADEYRQKQEQIATLGKLVLHTIDLLTQEIQEKSELVSSYDQQLEQRKRQLASAERCIQDYSNQLEECNFAKSLLERDLLEANEIRERYQTLYEEALSATKEEECHMDSTNEEASRRDSLPNDSFSEQHEKRQLELMLLEYELRQLKSQLAYKETLLNQKETARQQLLERLRNETDKSTAIHNNFKLLQENFRFAIAENQQLKRNICDLQNKLEQAQNSKVENEPQEQSQIIRRAMSRENIPFDNQKLVPPNSANAKQWMLRRSKSNFTIGSDKSSIPDNTSSRLNTLAAEMKAFDTESNQAINRIQYKFSAVTEKSVRISDLEEDLRSPRNLLSPRGHFTFPKIISIPIPEKLQEKVDRCGVSICSNCGCNKSVVIEPPKKGWLVCKIQSFYEELRQHAVTNRIQRHCHHKLHCD